MTKAWLLLRTLALAGSAVTFAGIALLTLAFPEAVARQYGYALASVDGRNEFRAIFFGFWLGLTTWLVTALRRRDLPLLGTLCGAAIGLQAIGRVLSVALDGVPSARMLGALAGEIATAVVLVATHRAAARRASGSA